jgi:hypothetical protein
MNKYFTNYNDYTSIMNIIGNDRSLSKEKLDAFVVSNLKFSFSTPRGPKKKAEYFNSKLGKYKIIKSMRGLYSWQKNDWCVYVSEKGFTFEVKEGLTTEQAFSAWEDFLLTMGYKSNV